MLDWKKHKILRRGGKNTGVGSHSPLQGNLPIPGIEPWSSALQADSLPAEPQGKPTFWRLLIKIES